MLAGEDVFLCILKDELCIKDFTVTPFCTLDFAVKFPDGFMQLCFWCRLSSRGEVLMGDPHIVNH